MNPILIVDDEAAIAMLVRRILTEAGYRCQAVTDSRAAANLLEKNRYDLVLLEGVGIPATQVLNTNAISVIKPAAAIATDFSVLFSPRKSPT